MDRTIAGSMNARRLTRKVESFDKDHLLIGQKYHNWLWMDVVIPTNSRGLKVKGFVNPMHIHIHVSEKVAWEFNDSHN